MQEKLTYRKRNTLPMINSWIGSKEWHVDRFSESHQIICQNKNKGNFHISLLSQVRDLKWTAETLVLLLTLCMKSWHKDERFMPALTNKAPWVAWVMSLCHQQKLHTNQNFSSFTDIITLTKLSMRPSVTKRTQQKFFSHLHFQVCRTSDTQKSTMQSCQPLTVSFAVLQELH